LEDNFLLKKPLIGVSILAIVILLLGSLVNVVGYQTVQTSQNNLIKEKNNQKELLFQTILDLANNKEIQQIIHKSPMMNGQSLYTDAKLPKPITKQQLRQMYVIGLLLSKIISKSTIQSTIQTHQLITSEMQQKIDAVIGNDAILKEEITQLLNSDCDCENEDATRLWRFPIICTLMIPLYAVGVYMFLLGWRWNAFFYETIGAILIVSIETLSNNLQCWWTRLPENNFPFISDISPADGEQNVPHNLTELSFRLTDHDGDLMSYKVTTNPPIGEGEGILVPNGTYTIPVQGLQHSTSYTWKLYLYEGEPIGTPLAPTYHFNTAPIAPIISNPTPKHNAPYVPIYTSNVSFDLTDYQGDLMNWTVETQPNIGSGAGNGVGNGRYTVAINDLEYETQYTWFVNVTDGTNWTRKTYVFTTTSEGLLVFEPMVYLYHPDRNWGSSKYIELYNNNRSLILVSFDLSEIPAGYTIISANLSMFYYEYNLETPAGRESTCHRILENWDEMTVTYNTKPAKDPVECASTIIPGNYTWVNWNVTSEVNDFINDGDMNYGWMLRDNKPFSNHNINHFYYSSNANNDRPPRLFVWFNPP